MCFRSVVNVLLYSLRGSNIIIDSASIIASNDIFTLDKTRLNHVLSEAEGAVKNLRPQE